MRTFCAFIATASLAFTGVAKGQQAIDVVRHADERARGKTSFAEVTIRIVRPSWSREMGMKIWSKGNDLALILITGPAKDRGISFLKKKKEVWNWIPSIERTIKLPPSMMSQSWMGTDFTNDDLVKEASMVEDYVHSFAAEESLKGLPCHTILMKPKPEAAVVWGKVILWIDKADFMVMRAEYYDEDDQLVNTLETEAAGILGGRMLPTRLSMQPADEPEHRTVMEYRNLVFDKPIDQDFFSTRNMQNVR